MHVRIARNLSIILSLFALGGCSTSGLVTSNVDLRLIDVEITQGEQVQEGAKFTHLLKEEIFHQFGKTNNQMNVKKNAKLSLEINKLQYPGNQTGKSRKRYSMMAATGELSDHLSGSDLGTLKLRVSHRDERYSVAGLPGEKFDNIELIQLMAKAILKKVYGNIRAAEIVDKPSEHARKPYVPYRNYMLSRNGQGYDKTNKNGKIGGLRLSLTNGILPPEFIGPPLEPDEDNKIPEVIEAPQLPIQ